MDLNDVARLRMSGQQITEKKCKTAKEIVGWMGAMQAQDYNMAKWAIGLRLPHATVKTIDTAIDQGEILRTHALRPTWHFVSADDIHWMIALTAAQIRTRMRSRNKELELTGAVFSKSNTTIESALTGRHLTREELMAEIKKAGIATENNRGAHLLLEAELEGIICSGQIKDKKPTYALLSERVRRSNTFNKDESLAKLALMYFSSHGPATLQDFVWWSGLSITHARHALEMVKQNLISETCNGETYWLPGSFSGPKDHEQSVHLLPAFDEYIISYKDRSASITLKNHKKAVSRNGIFWPVIVINGQVAGVWKRAIKKGEVMITTEFFQPVQNIQKELVERSAEAFGSFLGNKVMITHSH